ncbi:hypothetical protein LIER_16624 [Lithospermum erythrorhizon]|uniref:Uncharacterized protein n=1 Tax=Lithospermum erythrorhizon TaxID=34254 RepID=A0AAV3QA03_LITER
MVIARSKQGISESQRKYTLDLLEETGMLGCKSSNTPVELGNKDRMFEGDLVDKATYQQLVGKLIYLSLTRPDIGFAKQRSEAEYRAMTHGVCEVIWIKRIFKELNIQFNGPIQFYCDNQSAIRQQVADILSKGLAEKQFSLLLNKLGLINIYRPA